MRDKQNAQKINGFHSIISLPLIYYLIQLLFNHKNSEKKFSEFVGEKRNKRILDIGCGIGFDSKKYEEAQSYTGFDLSQKYIDHARRLYGDYGNFYCCSVDELNKMNLEKFDVVLLKGVLHHLSDSQIRKLIKNLKNHVRDGAVLVAIDPTFCKGQNFISKWFISNDRGKNVKQSSDSMKFFDPLLTDFQSFHLKQYIPPYDRLLIKGILKI